MADFFFPFSASWNFILQLQISPSSANSNDRNYTGQLPVAGGPASSRTKHTFGSKTFEMWAQRPSAGVCSEADANLTASVVGGGRRLIPQSAAGFLASNLHNLALPAGAPDRSAAASSVTAPRIMTACLGRIMTSSALISLLSWGYFTSNFEFSPSWLS